MRKRPVSGWNLLAGALLCVLFPWSTRPQAPADEGKNRFDLRQIETPEVLLNRALSNPARFEFIETPLNDVVEFLKDEHEIPITVDKRALEDEGVDTNTPITLNLSNVSLRAGLETILDPLGLTWVIRKEVLTLTTKIRAEDWLETRIYDVRDLLLAEGEPFVDEASYDYESLLEALEAATAADPNSSLDGRSEFRAIVPFHGMIVVSQPQHALRMIDQTLQELRQVRRQQQTLYARTSSAGQPADPLLVRVYRLPQLAGGDWLGDLGAESDLAGDERPSKPPQKQPETNSEEAISRVARTAHARAESRQAKDLAAMIPRMVAAESWPTSQTEIKPAGNTLVVKQRLSVHRKIKRFLEQLNTAAKAHPLHELTGQASGGFFQVPVAAVGVLAAAAPAPVNPLAAAPQDALPPTDLHVNAPHVAAAVAEISPRRKTELAIRQALGRNASLEVNETPLEDVISFLAKRHGVSIVLDYPSLENDGVNAAMPVSVNVANIRLSSLLDLILEGQSCSWLIRDQSVVVTSNSVAQNTLFTRAYPVAGLLVRDGESADPLDPDMNALVRLMRGAVAPQTWHPRGGMADLAILDGVMLVSQSHAAHEEIGRLLGEIARRQRARPHSSQPADPQAVSVRSYPLGRLDPVGVQREMAASPGWVVNNLHWGEETPPEGVPSASQRMKAVQLDAARFEDLHKHRLEFAQQLALALPHLVEPKSWDSAGGTGVASGLPGVLVVRQTSAVHARIRELIRKWEHDLDPFADERGLGGGFFFQVADAVQDVAKPEAAKPEAAKPDTAKPAEPAAQPVVKNPAEAPSSPRITPAAQARLRAMLDKKATLKLEEKPLPQVFELLQEKHGLPLKLDTRAIQDDGISLDVNLSLDLTEASLESVLEQLLEPMRLDWYFRDETLWIVPASSPKLLERKLYPVRDLLLSDPKRDVEADARPLETLVKRSIAVHSWQDTGGNATLKSLGDVLVIAQSRRGHKQVVRFLEDLRKARRQTPGKYEVPPEDPLLAKSVKMEVKGMALPRAMARLAETVGVPVSLDRKAFETSGLDPDQAVTIRVSDLELRSVLNLMLDPLGLAWQVKGKGIVVGPRMLSMHETRIYNVRHLLRAQADGRDYHYGPLVDAIKATVAAGEWADHGGEGTLEPFQGLLVVSHDSGVQAEIRELLEDISRLADRQRADSGLAPAAVRELDAVKQPPANEPAFTVVIYPLSRTAQAAGDGAQVQTLLNQLQAQLQGQAPPDAKTAVALVEQLLKALEIDQQKSHNESERVAKTARTLVEILPTSIAPKSWKGAGGQGQAHALPDAIIVRQDAEGHAQVRAILEKMGFEPSLSEQIGPFAR